MKPKRRTSSEENRRFWEAIDRLVGDDDVEKSDVRVGEPWTDSERNLSASLVGDEPSK